MVRLAHYLAGLVGIGLIGCVAHAAVMATGGYDMGSTVPLTIALAAGLGVGSIAIGIAWRDHRRLLALLLIVALMAGEGWALLLTAERAMAQRELQQAPLRLATEARTKATTRLTAASVSLAQIGETPRLARALTAKATADRAVVDSAAKRGCASNCRKLLEQQVETAEREVSYARAEISLARNDAEQEVSEARKALAALPASVSHSPLADRLGVAGWQVDITAASLASLAANGLAALLICFAAHGEHTSTPTRISWAAAKPDRDAAKEADWFARTTFQPQPSGRVPLVDLRKTYRDWCLEHDLDPLPDEEISTALSDLFAKVGLYRDGEGVDAAIVGIARASTAPALTHASPIA